MNSTEALAIIDRIAAAKGNAKLDVLEELLTDPFGVKVAQYTYDPFITYGITPKKPEAGWGEHSFNIYGGVFAILDSLAARRLTGNAAHDEVQLCYQGFNSAGGELLWRILSKDFRAGITAKSMNKIRPGTIMTFEVMLSQHYEERFMKGVSMIAGEPKLDGLRSPCLVKSGVGKHFSRVGNHFPALDDLGSDVQGVVLRMFDDIKERVEDGRALPIEIALLKMMGGSTAEHPQLVLDGETFSGLFNESSGAVRRKSVKATDVEFHVFDLIPMQFMTDYTKREFKVSNSARRAMLMIFMSYVKDEAIYLVPREILSTHEEVIDYYERQRDTTLASFLARGDKDREAELLKTLINKDTGQPQVLEGAMFKLLDAFYEKKKGRKWMKMKACETEDLRVVGYFEGKPHTKYEGQLGGLIVDRNGVEVRVGGGFSDAQRVEYWATPPIGRMLEVEFHEVTPDGSLRHSRFLRWRDDKDEALRVA